MTRNKQAELSPRGLPGAEAGVGAFHVSCTLHTRAAGIFSTAKVTQGRRAGRVFTATRLLPSK